MCVIKISDKVQVKHGEVRISVESASLSEAGSLLQLQDDAQEGAESHEGGGQGARISTVVQDMLGDPLNSCITCMCGIKKLSSKGRVQG
jgi:hypothetical protein